MNPAIEGTGDQEDVYPAPEQPAVGSRRVAYRQIGTFNDF